MPEYTFHHLHHEAEDVRKAVEFYEKLFGARAEPPFERAGATWVEVHLGDVTIMVTDRECARTALERYQGYDHLGVATDDFDATLAAVERHGIPVWTGPLTLENGQRIVFVHGPDQVKIEIVEKKK